MDFKFEAVVTKRTYRAKSCEPEQQSCRKDHSSIKTCTSQPLIGIFVCSYYLDIHITTNQILSNIVTRLGWRGFIMVSPFHNINAHYSVFLFGIHAYFMIYTSIVMLWLKYYIACVTLNIISHSHIRRNQISKSCGSQDESITGTYKNRNGSFLSQNKQYYCGIDWDTYLFHDIYICILSSRLYQQISCESQNYTQTLSVKNNVPTLKTYST